MWILSERKCARQKGRRAKHNGISMKAPTACTSIQEKCSHLGDNDLLPSTLNEMKLPAF